MRIQLRVFARGIVPFVLLAPSFPVILQLLSLMS